MFTTPANFMYSSGYLTVTSIRFSVRGTFIFVALMCDNSFFALCTAFRKYYETKLNYIK